MEDSKIVKLYLERNEKALYETKSKYGKYCYCIAYNILSSHEDSEECVSDTYVSAWNSIPPNEPKRLSTYLGKITRNLAINQYAAKRAQKRFSSAELVLDEISEFIPDSTTDGRDFTSNIALKDALNFFLAGLSKTNRIIFVRRYWYLCSIKDIAKDLGLTESNVKVTLHRLRGELKAHLIKEEIDI